jgi:hypothetical protein
MDQAFDITLQGEKVGQMLMKRQGTYYMLEGLCDFPTNVRYQLNLQCGTNTYCLGICVPYGNQMGVRTRIKVSTIGERNPVFYISQMMDTAREAFFPVNSGAPFGYVHRLTKGFFAVRKGERGIVIPLKK